MKRVIFSYWYQLENSNHPHDSFNYTYKNNIIQLQKQYADKIGVKYLHFSNNEFLESLQPKYSHFFNSSNSIYLYKLLITKYLFDEGYSSICYMDCDCVPNPNKIKSIFDVCNSDGYYHIEPHSKTGNIFRPEEPINNICWAFAKYELFKMMTKSYNLSFEDFWHKIGYFPNSIFVVQSKNVFEKIWSIWQSVNIKHINDEIEKSLGFLYSRLQLGEKYRLKDELLLDDETLILYCRHCLDKKLFIEIKNKDWNNWGCTFTNEDHSGYVSQYQGRHIKNDQDRIQNLKNLIETN